MNTLRKSLLIGMTVLGLGSAGMAAHAEDNQGRHGHVLSQEAKAQYQAKFAERIAKRQAALHDKLKLTAAQEPAWATFKAATTPQLPAAHADRAALAQLSAPERAEKHLAMVKEHIARQETRVAALKTFYAVLSPEQQKTLDAELAHRRHHGWHGQHGAGRQG
ncbi:MAG: Spy/CpxP family protein refolding chaperone [Pseudomonadota bacterium]